ncbi:MAG: glycosyltransferase, partial [Bryobacteraceae bacterium]|nr:glycosyltransferase [Bryobacteraceae bacterium]
LASDTEPDRALWDGVEVFAGKVVGPAAFGYCPELPHALGQARVDVLHLQGLWMYPSVACRGWARGNGGRYVVSPQGMLDPWALRNSAWKKRLAAWAYENANLRGAACLHAVCEAEARAMRAYGLRNPIAVIPNGVDVPREAASSPPPWEALVPEGAKVLLYLGRLHHKKGLPNLLRAWNAVRAEGAGQQWRLVIAGWDQGGHEAELRRLAGEVGLAGNVVFVGPQFGQDKEASFRRADAFVLPSFSEGLPVVVLEAWAFGLPVVMTPQCNLPEGFQAGAALSVDPEPGSIAAGLRDLFAMSDAERRAMGERGRRLVEERFSWPKIAAQMKQVYEWVLGGGPRPEWVRLD